VEFENADYVFRAVVTATETIDVEDAGIIDFEEIGVELSVSARKALEMVKVTFDQIKNYKGDASEVKYLFIPSSARLCNGPTPEIGVSGTSFTDKSGHIPGCGPSWMGQSHIQGFTIDQVKKLSIQYQEKCKKSFEQTPAAGTPQLAQERTCR
jgi:hypothetical protein